MAERRCRFCRKTFHETYDQHNQSCSRIPNKCRLCGRGFTNNHLFERHLGKCVTDIVSCPKCDFTGTREDLIKHHHCQYCGDTGTGVGVGVGSLIEHERICQDNPKNLVECKLCKNCFAKDIFSKHECVITCERCDSDVDPSKKDLHPCFQAKKIAKLTDRIRILEGMIQDSARKDRYDPLDDKNFSESFSYFDSSSDTGSESDPDLWDTVT